METNETGSAETGDTCCPGDNYKCLGSESLTLTASVVDEQLLHMEA